MAAVPFGSLPGQGGRHSRRDLLLDAGLGQRHPGARQARRLVRELGVRQDRRGAGRVRRGAVAQRGRAVVRGLGRERRSCSKGGVVVTPPVTTDDVLEGFTRATGDPAAARGHGTRRWSSARSTAPSSTWRTRCSSPGPGPRSPRSRAPIIARSAAARIGPLAAALRARYYEVTAGRVARTVTVVPSVHACSPAVAGTECHRGTAGDDTTAGGIPPDAGRRHVRSHAGHCWRAAPFGSSRSPGRTVTTCCAGHSSPTCGAGRSTRIATLADLDAYIEIALAGQEAGTALPFAHRRVALAAAPSARTHASAGSSAGEPRGRDRLDPARASLPPQGVQAPRPSCWMLGHAFDPPGLRARRVPGQRAQPALAHTRWSASGARHGRDLRHCTRSPPTGGCSTGRTTAS